MTSRCLSPFFHLFDADHAAQDHFASSCMIGFFNAAIAADDAACRKIGTRHHFHDLVDRGGWIVQQQEASL